MDRDLFLAILAMLFAALLTILGGCREKVGPPPKDTSAFENPPPKLPDCPPTPELKNVTLPDGAFADVRIIQFDHTKLYFPASWLRSAFLDVKPKYRGFHSVQSLQRFDPDLHLNECPCVVHKLIPIAEIRGKNRTVISITVGGPVPIRTSENVGSDQMSRLLLTTNEWSTGACQILGQPSRCLAHPL